MKQKQPSVVAFTYNDLLNLEVAVRLRAESCEDNDHDPQEKAEAKHWRRLLKKVERLQVMARGKK